MLQYKDNSDINSSLDIVNKISISCGRILNIFSYDRFLSLCMNYPLGMNKYKPMTEQNRTKQNNRGNPEHMLKSQDILVLELFSISKNDNEYDVDKQFDKLFYQYIYESDYKLAIKPKDDPMRIPYTFLKYSYNEMIYSLKKLFVAARVTKYTKILIH